MDFHLHQRNRDCMRYSLHVLHALRAIEWPIGNRKLSIRVSRGKLCNRVCFEHGALDLPRPRAFLFHPRLASLDKPILRTIIQVTFRVDPSMCNIHDFSCSHGDPSKIAIRLGARTYSFLGRFFSFSLIGPQLYKARIKFTAASRASVCWSWFRMRRREKLIEVDPLTCSPGAPISALIAPRPTMPCAVWERRSCIGWWQKFTGDREWKNCESVQRNRYSFEM